MIFTKELTERQSGPFLALRFVRRTKTATAASGAAYHSFRWATSERDGGRVRQRTLLNLGRNFPLPRAPWPEFCERVEPILSGQLPLIETDRKVEELAQHGAARLIAQGAAPANREEADGREIDVHSLELLLPRSVGAGQVSLEALKRLGLRPACLSVPGPTGGSAPRRWATSSSACAPRAASKPPGNSSENTAPCGSCWTAILNPCPSSSSTAPPTGCDATSRPSKRPSFRASKLASNCRPP